MILLCDLDGTLLSNSMKNFQPAYLKKLGEHLASQLPPDRMLRELLLGTKEMLENDNPLVTLEEAFDAHFYPQLGVEKQTIIDLILDFYRNEFPSLGYLTRQIPEAIEFIQDQISSGNRVVVATNPLFPRIATFNRLVWAGLPVEQVPFELVTTYEFMHFAKPRAAYYAEILAYLGYPKEPVIMVGNDLKEDILAARQLNIPAFWLTVSEPINGGSLEYPLSGTFKQLRDYLIEGVEPPHIYDGISIPAFTASMKATLAALHTYDKNGFTINSDDMPISLNALISDLDTAEHNAIMNLFSDVGFKNFKDGITRAIPYDPADILLVFTQNRLQWLCILRQIDIQSLDSRSSSILTSFITGCITRDRNLMSFCADRNKEWPRFARPIQ
ncbi:MAG: HAD family hydrolase [Anaerolineaceae bacterium]